MIIENEKMVSVAYTLNKEDAQGELIEQVSEVEPLKFIFGKGMLLPKFESNLYGKKIGDSFKFILTPIDAYGEYSDDRVMDLDIKIFKENGKLNTRLIRVGNSVPMLNASGERIVGTVQNIADNFVTMDFNHPLAGDHLFFRGKIVDIKAPTPEDLEMFTSERSCDKDCNSGCKGCG